MLQIAERSCSCRGCTEIIKAGARISWVDGSGPYHLTCTPSNEDKELAVEEILSAERIAKDLHDGRKTSARLSKLRTLRVRAMDILCFVLGPMMVAANADSFLPRHYSANRTYFAIGVGLIAFGLLRKFWLVKGNK